MIKLAIVGTNGVPANYGGLETLTENLTKLLDEKFRITIYCSKNRRSLYPEKFGNAYLIYSRLKANGWQSILYDTWTTVHALIKNDVVVLMGPGVGMVLLLNILLKKKIVVNHGGLDEWNREKYSWFERKFLYYSTKFTALLSQVNVADNTILANSLKENFSVNSVVIRYGGDYSYKYTDEIRNKYSKITNLNKYYISVSRAQIDNNIHIVIDAFLTMKENVVIISNWSISEYGKNLWTKYANKYENIILLDAIYDKDELGYLRDNAFAYIHSHSRCGTAPSLVEAMWQNKYPICFDVPTNRETTFNDSSYFNNAQDLVDVVKKLDDVCINKFSDKNYAKIASDYTWKKISDEYAKVFL